MKKHMLGASAMIALAGFSTLVAPASADVLYRQTFESGSYYPEFSTNQHTTSTSNFTRYMGRYTNSTVTLTLGVPQPPPGGLRDGIASGPIGGGTGGSGGSGSGGGGRGGGGGSRPPALPRFQLNFDFYCIDSWDGSDTAYGVDRFGVTVNGASIFSETFANQHNLQTFRNPDIGRAHLGYDRRWLDSIYHLSIFFETTQPTVRIGFTGSGLQSMGDESWGIDNITLMTAPSVPAPGAAALLGLGGLVAARRRR